MGKKRDIDDPYFDMDEIVEAYPDSLEYSNDDDEEDGIVLIDDCHWDLGTRRVIENEKRKPIIEPGEPVLNFFRFAFSKMEQHAKAKERYAIGYVRFGRKALKQGALLSNSVESQVLHNRKIPSFSEQEKAIQNYAKEKKFTLFHTFSEVQAGRKGYANNLEIQSVALHLCDLYNAAFIYCDTGSFNKYPEFFNGTKAAEEAGIPVIPIADDEALLSVIRNSRKRTAKKPPAKEKQLKQLRRDEKETLARLKYPILNWKADNEISTKRFNHFEYLFNGHYPIYRYFLSEETRNESNPDEWKRNPLSYSKLASSLNEMGMFTKGGYEWTKQTTRKVKQEIIFSDLFADYAIEKFRIRKQIDDNKLEENEIKMAEKYGSDSKYSSETSPNLD